MHVNQKHPEKYPESQNDCTINCVICHPLFAADIARNPVLCQPGLPLHQHSVFRGLGIISETFRQISGFFLTISNVRACHAIYAGMIQAFLIDKNKGIFLVWVTVLTFVISYLLSYRIPMVPRYLLFLNIVFFIGIAISYKIFYRLINNRAVVYGFIVFFNSCTLRSS